MNSPQISSHLDFSKILSPKSVAVVGASRRQGSVGEAIFKNILHADYQGVIYPVNPKADFIGGVKCYLSLSDLPGPVDLAVLIVPATSVPKVLEECGSLHIPGVIVVSAGFKEVGGAGIELEEQVKNIAESNGIALLGPNCLGFINTDPAVQLNASFAQTMPKPGNIAFVSQSGALCTAVLDYAKGENIGFSKFISMGNKAMANEVDFLRALRDDPLTDVILLYVEDISDGQEFINVAKSITGEIPRPKPIIAIKSGRTEEGAKAAASHTGSLAGSDNVYDAVFMQSGVMRVETVEELFNYGVAFSKQPLPKGNRVAIVTNAGGPGIMATDAAIRHGLTLAPLTDETKAELKKHLPSTANLNNPVDVIGDARHDRYEAALQAVIKDPNVDGVVVILTPQAMTNIREIGEVVANVAKSMEMSPWHSKPLLASFMGIVDVSEGIHILENAGVPHYTFPENAVRALAKMAEYQNNWLSRPRTEVKNYVVQKELAKKIFDSIRAQGLKFLSEPDALKVLSAYGIPGMETIVVQKEEEAVKAAQELGYPVVLKIVSPEIVHKVDVGGVALNINDNNEVSRQFRKIYQTATAVVGADKITGIEVQKMADQGLEVFLGAKKNPAFGHVLVFGLGGTFVEVFKDAAFRVAPLNQLSTRRIMEETKAYILLDGYRGVKRDIDRVQECLGRLSQLVIDFPEIQELDINPLIVYPEGNGVRAADCRIFLGSEKTPSS